MIGCSNLYGIQSNNHLLILILMNTALRIGLIGGIASGKSTALQFFLDQGVECFSADKIAHQLLAQGQSTYQAICKHLGDEVKLENGDINRSKLRERLILQPTFKIWLEKLMHPQIQKKLIDLAKLAKSPYCVLEIPLLKDPKVYQIQRVLYIDCKPATQIQRLQQRQLTPEEINGLMKLQVPHTERIKMATELIENSGNLKLFYQQLAQVHQLYLDLSKGQSVQKNS